MTDTSPLLLLFDIDGTLVDSAGAGLGALQMGLIEAFGLEDRAESMPELDLAGTTDAAVARLLFDAFEIEDTPSNRKRFFQHYSVHLERKLAHSGTAGRLLPGAGELLAHLKAETNHALALLTGNIESGARIKLKRYGVEHYFPFGAFGDDREHRNQLGPVALERARSHTGKDFSGPECVIIGDTPRDISCAKAFGARCIAIATGRFHQDDLAIHEPDAVLPDLRNLNAFLKALGS